MKRESRHRPTRWRARAVWVGLLGLVTGLAIYGSSVWGYSPWAQDEIVAIPKDKSRQFDFWVGDWQVDNKHLKPDGNWRSGGVADAEIRSALDGKVILEQWTGRKPLALRGFSLRTYDAEQERWEIVLNWHSGAPSTFSFMVGNFEDERGEFFPLGSQKARKTRFTFSKARQNSCQWDQATSSDGEQYQTNWIMSFSRRGPASSVDASNLPIKKPAASITKTFPIARQLDRLIGVWKGTAKRKLSDGTWAVGTATRRTSAMIDGLGLLQLTDYSWGEQTVAAISFNTVQQAWFEVGTSTLEPDCHWLNGSLDNHELELVEQASSNNGVQHRWSNMSEDAYDWQRTIKPATSSQTDYTELKVSFKRSAEQGKISAIPQIQRPSSSLQRELGKARVLLGQNNAAGAQQVLERLIAQNPNHGPAHFFLGYSLHAQKKFDQALQTYNRAKTLPQPVQRTVATIEFNIACIYSLKNNPDQAFRHLELAMQAGFNNPNQFLVDTDLDNIRNDPRFGRYTAGPAVTDDQLLTFSKTNDPSSTPARILKKFEGEAAGDQFGWTARRVGDWDGDGVTDFVATAPTHAKAGKIYVYSSKTGDVLLTKSGKPGERFGNSSVGCGDTNGDGESDLIVGAPNGRVPGNAYIFDRKGQLLHHLKGKKPGDQFGYEVSELGDIDADGHHDVLVGAIAADGKQPRAGSVAAYSGKTGKVLFTLQGERTGDAFGNAAACKQNQDGSFTLAIGAQNAGPKQRGRVYVYRIEAGIPKSLFVVEGDRHSVNLGQMFISFPGDVDQDGLDDIYASDFSDSTLVAGGGKVVVVSAKDGRALTAIHGKRKGEGLGTSPSDAGDVNGDGIGDLIVGAWQNDEGAKSGGKVYLFDGKTGAEICAWTCQQAGDTFGFDACGIGDVDGDGAIDFLLTSAWSNSKGTKTGRVLIVAGIKP